MKWIRERDALIAQTLAFVQSVTARSEPPPDVEALLPPPVPSTSVPLPAIDFAFEALRTPSNLPAEPVPSPRPRVSREVEEIRQRIASFRSHQERFRREREEYFSATVAKMQATLRQTPPPRPGK